MYPFWDDYVKPTCEEKDKLCYMDTDSFTGYIKTEDIYVNIAKDVQKRFKTSNYELERPLLQREKEKVTGLMKDELGGKIMTEFATLKPKMYKLLTDDNDGNKNAKNKKKSAIKLKLKFEDYQYC